jgi:hypothetical protein
MQTEYGREGLIYPIQPAAGTYDSEQAATSTFPPNWCARLALSFHQFP